MSDIFVADSFNQFELVGSENYRLQRKTPKNGNNIQRHRFRCQLTTEGRMRLPIGQIFPVDKEYIGVLYRCKTYFDILNSFA